MSEHNIPIGDGSVPDRWKDGKPEPLITIEQLRAICPYASKNVDVFISYLNKYMHVYGIITREQKAMFIAQVAHESGSFRYTQEIASGKAYEGRKDLGNVHEGDGKFFKGRGLLQITGRTNYKLCSLALFFDDRLLKTPQLLETPEYAVASACWYWDSHNLNAYANDIVTCTEKINGGHNGLKERKEFYKTALKVFK